MVEGNMAKVLDIPEYTADDGTYMKMKNKKHLAYHVMFKLFTLNAFFLLMTGCNSNHQN
jgi:hypothetical protein